MIQSHAVGPDADGAGSVALSQDPARIPALPCWATSTEQELNEMPTCNIRHEPGSDAQKTCAVHGRRMGRQVTANLTPPMLRPKTPALAIPELPDDVAEGLLCLLYTSDAADE